MAPIAAVKFALTSLLLAVSVAAPQAQARGWNDRPEESRPAPVRVAELPTQARDIYGRIRQGGPFQYEKDGSVFGNRERMLPRATRGYYREYTVPTPGSRDRGARRIVCGGPARTPRTCYYSADHYASFRQIVE
jgi:ribonuclease T1